ncbi:acyltransferase family protein [Limosilactobacillus fermentum]|uniref:acyltransferase family protein n=1 Tax=Limosilactobacillus fermentum TaxID=1613 RepID=UPI0032EFF909
MKKRIEWLDFGRGFTIFLVVVAHVLGGIYTNNIYSQSVNDVLSPLGETVFLVIMPIFFSLSGYVYRDPRDRTDYY